MMLVTALADDIFKSLLYIKALLRSCLKLLWSQTNSYEICQYDSVVHFLGEGCWNRKYNPSPPTWTCSPNAWEAMSSEQLSEGGTDGCGSETTAQSDGQTLLSCMRLLSNEVAAMREESPFIIIHGSHAPRRRPRGREEPRRPKTRHQPWDEKILVNTLFKSHKNNNKSYKTSQMCLQPEAHTHTPCT